MWRRYLVGGVVVWILGSGVASAQSQLCNGVDVQSVNIDLAAANNTVELVPAPVAPDRSVYVCGYVLTAGGAVLVSWASGTGTACGTAGAVHETLDLSSSVGLGIALSNAGAVQFATGPGRALCVTRSAGTAVTLRGRVTYVVR